MQMIIMLLLPLLLHLPTPMQCFYCPTHCQCASSFMDCKRPGLGVLPSAPSSKVEMVVIGNQTFARTTLDQEALQPYQSSEHNGHVRLRLLKIHNCNIVSIASGAFAKLGSHLEELDLSGNPLRIIEAHAFTGLRLKSLFLNNLQNPVIHDQAFSSIIEVQSLSLQNSHLTSLPLRPLIELVSRHGLKSLSIKGNAISRLPPVFEPTFRLLSSFELSDNPWHCDCNLRWLIQLQRWNRWTKTSGAFARSNGDGISDIRQPTCISPVDFSGYNFDEIIVNESETHPDDYLQTTVVKRRILVCVMPRVEHVEVDLRQQNTAQELDNRAQIACQLKGASDLFVIWFYHDPNGNLRNVTEMAEEGNGLSYALASSQAKRRISRLSVRQLSESDVYSCQGQNILGNASVTVSIHWPHKIREGKVDSSGSNEGNSGEKLLPSDISRTLIGSVPPAEYRILAKQFSLMDVIGAVLGTFLVTMVVFIIAYRTSKLYVYRRAKFRAQSDSILRHNRNTKRTPDGTSSSAASSSLMKFSQYKVSATPRSPPGYPQTSYQHQGGGRGGLSLLPKQHDSGTLTSRSTTSSQNATGQSGAYETVYNETPTSQVMYETPEAAVAAAAAAYHPNQQSFLFPFGQSTPLTGYPLMFGSTIPSQSSVSAYALGVSSPSVSTYIPPPPPPMGHRPAIPCSVPSHAGPLQQVNSSTMHISDQCLGSGASASVQTPKPVNVAPQRNQVT